LAAARYPSNLVGRKRRRGSAVEQSETFRERGERTTLKLVRAPVSQIGRLNSTPICPTRGFREQEGTPVTLVIGAPRSD